MLEYLRQSLMAALEARAALKAEVDAATKEARDAKRDLTEAEAKSYSEARSKVEAKDAEIDEIRNRIKDAEADEAREARLADVRREAGVDTPKVERAGGPAVVTREERTYRAFKDQRGQVVMDPEGPSFFRDLVKHSLNLPGAGEARQRLQRSAQEDQVEARSNPEQRALTTTDGAGGDFVPPVWLVNEYIALARAARPTADRVRNLPLPAGTDSINIPRISGGTAVAEAATQNTSVQNTDATTNAVTAAVTTIAGQQVLSVQLIEQSPVNMDDILLADLALAYAATIDTFVLSNNATSKKGLLSVSGTNGVTLSTATTVAMYPKLADATQQVYTKRFLPPDTVLMHPRRWASICATLDSQNRPLVVPNGSSFNNLATGSVSGQAQGTAGEIFGLPVVLDPNIPTNLGTGTNEDRIIVLRASEAILWEGGVHLEAFRETKADTLSVLLRFYRYAAFTGERYPSAISVISGAGLATPTF